MNQRNDVGGSVNRRSVNAPWLRQLQTYQQAGVNDPVQTVQQELARISALRQQLQQEQDKMMAYEAGLAFAVSKHNIDKLLANSQHSGIAANGLQGESIYPVQATHSGRNAVMERLLARPTPAVGRQASGSALPQPNYGSNGENRMAAIQANIASAWTGTHTTTDTHLTKRSVMSGGLEGAMNIVTSSAMGDSVDSLRSTIYPHTEIEEFRRNRRAADRTTREDQLPSRRYVPTAGLASQGNQGIRPMAATTIGSTTISSARIEPLDNTAVLQQQKRPLVKWEDVAENLELPLITPITNVIAPLSNPTVQSRIIYVKYRIAELRYRNPRLPAETRFLEMLIEWAEKSSFPLPKATHYPRLLQLMQKLKYHERRGVQGRSVGTGASFQPDVVTAPPDVLIAPPHASLPSVAASSSSITQATLNKVMPPAKALLALLALGKKPAPSSIQRSDVLNSNPSGTQATSSQAIQFQSILREYPDTSGASTGTELSTSNQTIGPDSTTEASSSRLPIAAPAILSSRTDVPNPASGPDHSDTAFAHAEPNASRSPFQENCDQASLRQSTPPVRVILAESAPESQAMRSSTSLEPALTSDGIPTAQAKSMGLEKPILMPSGDGDTSMEPLTTELPNDSHAVYNPPAHESALASETSPRDDGFDELEEQLLATPHEWADLPRPKTTVGESANEMLTSKDTVPREGMSEQEESTGSLSAPTKDAQNGIRQYTDGRIQADNARKQPTVPFERSAADDVGRQAAPIEEKHNGAGTPTTAALETTPESSPYGTVNMRIIRSIPTNKMWVEIPVRKSVSKPRPKPRPRSPSPRKFTFWPPEHALDRFNKSCVSKVLGSTLLRRSSLRPCGWSECDAELGSEWQLHSHFTRVHASKAKLEKRCSDEVDAWACLWKDCSGLYASQGDLKQHVQTIHIQDGLRCPYTTCPRPDERYFNVGHLETHIARNPLTHARQNVRPLMDLSVRIDHRFDVDVPREIHRADLLPVKAPRSVWQTARQKHNAINRVQEFSFVDREDRRMRSGESPPPIDMPVPSIPVTNEEEEDEEVESGTIVVKKEPNLPYSLRDKDVRKPKQSVRQKLELEVVIEITRPLVEGN